MSPIVSIIIPAYNSQKYLGDTLDTIFNQIWQDFEVLIIDDGSTDNTQSVIEQYQNKYPGKIRSFTQENGGAGKARNLGLKNARGRYIAFIDADDLWEPDKLETQMKYFDEHKDIGFIYANARRIDDNGNVLEGNYSQPHEFELASEVMFDKMLMRNFVPFSSIVVKKSIVDEVGYFGTNYGNTEDFEYVLRIVHDHKAHGINRLLVRYRIHAQNVSHDNEARHGNGIKILKEMTTRFPDINDRLGPVIRTRFANRHYEYGCALFANHDYTKARLEFLQSIKKRPFLKIRKYFYFLASLLPSACIKYLRNIKQSV